MLKKKVTSVAMSAVLAATLCPGLALAAPLEAGSAAPEKAPTTLSTQAKGKTVYVLTAVDDYEIGVQYDQKTGLITSTSSYDFGYKGINLNKITEKNDPESSYKTTYKVKSKKGFVTSATVEETNTSNPLHNEKSAYTYKRNKKGGLTKLTTKTSNMYYGNKKFKKYKVTETDTTKYTYKKGKLKKSVSSTKRLSGEKTTSAPYTYKWDKKGNLQKRTRPYEDVYYTYSYKYDPKTKCPTVKTTTYPKYEWVEADDDYKITGYSSYDRKLTYTAIKVNKKYVPIVKAQQWALLNDNMNYAFGPVNPYSVY